MYANSIKGYDIRNVKFLYNVQNYIVLLECVL